MILKKEVATLELEARVQWDLSQDKEFKENIQKMKNRHIEEGKEE